jgi:hypothetical protein
MEHSAEDIEKTSKEAHEPAKADPVPIMVIIPSDEKSNHRSGKSLSRLKTEGTEVPEQQKMSSRFYKSIDPSLEFGVSRTVSDKLYHLPKLLVQPQLTWQEGTTTYIIQSSTPDSAGNTITLEHRLHATSHEEAEKIAAIVADRLRGILHKILMAAWKLANDLKQFTFTCELTHLMRLCNPDRTASFQSKDKIEFYEHLRSLENTKIVYSRKDPSKSGKKAVTQSIEIRLIEIHNKTGKKEEYPQTITLSVLNAPALQNEKMAFVGAGFKNTTLELHVDDISLAAWLQSRKAQLNNADKTTTIDEDYLFKVAGVEKTALLNKSMARRRLLKKLERYAKQGIIELPIRKQGSSYTIHFR